MDAFTTLDALRRSFAACAECDEALYAKEYLRSFTWTPAWSPGVDLGVYDNGGGDSLHVFLAEDWGLIIGHDHESAWSPASGGPLPGTFDGLPEAIRPTVDAFIAAERARQPEIADWPPRISFAWWRAPATDFWAKGPVQPPEKRDPNDDGGQRWLGQSLPHQWGDYLEPKLPLPIEEELVTKQVFAAHGFQVGPPWPRYQAPIPIGTTRPTPRPPSLWQRLRSWFAGEGSG